VTSPALSRAARALVLSLLAAGCGATPVATPDASVDVASVADVPALPPRAAGTRAPPTAECDPADPTRCLLPWPSDVFAERADTATGLCVRVAPARTLNRDDVATLSRADGFSRATPVLAGLPQEIDRTTLGDGLDAAIRVVVSEPGASLGETVPMRMHLVADAEGEPPGTLLVGFPRSLLRAASEHVAVLTDRVRDTSGRAPTASRHTRVALGLDAPRDDAERALVAYHAPSRQALTAARIDPARVVRVWTFTTRSAAQPRDALRVVREAMIRAVREGNTRVTVTTARAPADGPVAVIAEGFLEGLPNPMSADNVLRFDARGAVTFGESDFRAPWRVMIPRGTGAWPVVLWGHGTGGDVRDTSFDAVIAAAGAAKLNFEFDGWTGDRVIETFAAFTRVLNGVDVSSARLVRALGGAAAVTEALFGTRAPLADALAGDTLGTAMNPVAGRRPRAQGLVYAGGSLGGTMGAVIARTEPRVQGAVLNVPGAAWSHYTPFANLFAVLRPSLRVNYGSETDLWVFLAMSQSLWDLVDGATWADDTTHRVPTLLQQSMGDPVLPNLGTEFLAAALGARHLGAALSPVFGAMSATEVTEGAALTQFRVSARERDALDIHGFAARDTPAGLAAQAQLSSFALSVQAGTPRITLPDACARNTPAGSCDFSAR
jgi:hypothetical protein